MKYLFTVFILVIFSFYLPCYSGSSEEKFDRHDQSLSLVYIGFGNESLKLKKFSLALDDCKKAFALLGKPENHPPELDVLILFGEVIAYDNLGSKEECLKYLTELKSIINSEYERESVELSYDCNDLSLEDHQKAIETTSDLFHLASLACSQEIKEELFVIINNMFEDIQEQLYTRQTLELPATQEKVELCKAKWIKKLEKIARRAYRIFQKVKEVCEFVKDVDNTCNSNNEG